MEKDTTKEKKNKITGIYVSVGIHAVLLLVFFMMLAWTEPDPPIPEYGIEFSMGNSIANNSSQEEPVSQPEIDEVEEVSESEVEPEPVQETQSEAAEQNDSQETETENSEEASVATEDINSPDVVEEKVAEKEEKEKNVEETDQGDKDKTTETNNTSQTEAAEKSPVKEPELDDRAIFKGKEGGAGAGNKGSSLDLSGWDWDSKPKPNDTSSETGTIVFQITIDDEGEIIGIKTLKKTVSPVVEKIYKNAVMDLTFSKTMSNRSTAATSIGKITFIIQSK